MLARPVLHSATPEELAKPPVTLERARIVLMVGFMSGKADWCGLDWQEQLYLPLMRYFRKVERLEPRVLTILGMLHGYAQGRSRKAADGQRCTDEIRGGGSQILAHFADTLSLELK